MSEVPPTRMNQQIFKVKKKAAQSGHKLLKKKADALKVGTELQLHAGMEEPMDVDPSHTPHRDVSLGSESRSGENKTIRAKIRHGPRKKKRTQSMVVEEYPAVCFARHDTTRHEKRIPSAGSHQCGQCAAVPIGHFFGLVRDKATHDNVMLEHTCRLMHSCIHWQNSDIVWFESIRFILSITLARNVHHVSLCLTEPSTFLSLSLDLSVCIGQIP